MDIRGKCKILRIYFGEDEKVQRKSLQEVLMKELMACGVAGATIYRGLEGFGTASHIHGARILEIMEDLPIILEVVDKPKHIRRALNRIKKILPARCLVTLQDVQVVGHHLVKDPSRAPRRR